MARLPTPGGDSGAWGAILNDYLSQAHNADGTIKAAAISSKADDSAVVHSSGAETVSGVKTFTSSPIVPTPSSGTEAANKTYVDGVAGAGAPDASTTTKGIVQLAGDLSGTATSPQIATGVIVNSDINASAAIAKSKLANLDIVDADVNASAAIAQSKINGLSTSLSGKQDVDADLTAIAGLSPSNDDVIQRKSGAWTNRTMAQVKTDLSLTKTDVGLANVDNTSDANKPVSTATQTALDAKTDEATLTTKGDLYVATAASTITRLPVGTDTHVLTADSALAAGVKWAAVNTAFQTNTAAGWAAANPVLAAGAAGYETDTGVVRVGDGSTAYLNLTSGMRTCRQTSNATNSSGSTNADVPGMSFALQAGHRYEFRFVAASYSDLSTAGVLWTLSIPAITAGWWREHGQQSSTGGTSMFWEGANATLGSLSAVANASTNSALPWGSILEGVIQPSADGTMQLRFRSEVDGQLQTVLAVYGIGHITDVGYVA